MIRAMWTAATNDGPTTQRRHDRANNLANVKHECVQAQPCGIRRPAVSDSTVSRHETRRTSACFPWAYRSAAASVPLRLPREWMQGNMRQTEQRPRSGHRRRRFFQVARPDGTIMYTRNGSFKRDNVGNLVTGDGDQLTPVITIPSARSKSTSARTARLRLAPRCDPGVAGRTDSAGAFRQSLRSCRDGRQFVPRQFCVGTGAAGNGRIFHRFRHVAAGFWKVRTSIWRKRWST